MIVAFCALRASLQVSANVGLSLRISGEIQQPADCYSATGLRGRSMAGEVNTIGQSKRGGGDRSSRPAQLQARENEQRALSLWIKGAT